ncbi:MAG: hypothetical protein CL912_09605 [Deltaproteobacteria bacterium]|nr:hypothetical protein [Deltaproteobacteria bacterium]
MKGAVGCSVDFMDSNRLSKYTTESSQIFRGHWNILDASKRQCAAAQKRQERLDALWMQRKQSACQNTVPNVLKYSENTKSHLHTGKKQTHMHSFPN